MAHKAWIAILGFAVCFFSAFGLFYVYLWMTRQISNREGWGALGLSLFTVSSSYRALQMRLKSKSSQLAEFPASLK